MARQNNLKGPGPGRPTGSQNKLNKTVQECILDAFHSKEIGGVHGLIEWGKQMGNRESFYKLLSRLIPKPMTMVNVDVGNQKPKIDLEEVLTKARDRINRIRNEGDDSQSQNVPLKN